MKAMIVLLITGFLAWAISACSGDVSASDKAKTVAKTPEQQGKYLVMIGGCNDCHTPGYMESDGKSPAESEWLTGSPVGFRGPWGTTFPSNLRLFVEETSEDDFVKIAKSRKLKPPMPWPSLNNMDEEDLRAIHAYIKSLGPKGQRAPEYVEPDQEPAFPYFEFEPKHLERLSPVAK